MENSGQRAVLLPDAESSISRRAFWTLALLVLVLGGVWRVWLATAMPCLSRDGVLYCRFARGLGERGSAVLREGEYGQHPLYSLTILGVQRALLAGGWEDSPMTWQRSGQVVAWVAGMAVVCLSGLLAHLIVRGLGMPLDARGCVLAALALAAILPLNTRLSAEVMSDELHAALYLAGVVCLTRLDRGTGALGAGLFSGLAFVTRPEGAAVALAGGLSLVLCRTSKRRRRTAGAAALLAAGFVLVAGPYWIASGRLSPKVDKETINDFQATLLDPGPLESPPAIAPQYAALVRRETDWYEAVPWTLYHIFRAGRVVVPLLAIVPLIVYSRRWRSQAVFGSLACMSIHYALLNLLIVRHGYLSPRYALVIVALLIPFAALLLGFWCSQARRAKRVWLLGLVALACFSPLAWYATRVPNGEDAALPRVAAILAAGDARRREKLLLGGAIERRIAFYADTRWQPWPENEPDPERRFEQLRRHLLDATGSWRPDYLAITTGEADELRHNRALLGQLLADARAARVLRELHVEPRGAEGAVHLYALDFAAEPD